MPLNPFIYSRCGYGKARETELQAALDCGMENQRPYSGGLSARPAYAVGGYLGQRLRRGLVVAPHLVQTCGAKAGCLLRCY